MESRIDPGRLSHLIGLIYDCVLDPGRWQPTVDALREASGFATANLSLHALPQGTALLSITSNIAPEWLQKLHPLSESAAESWGGAARLAEIPLAEPVVHSHMVDRTTLENSAFYQQWAKPQGLCDQAAIMLVRQSDSLSALGLGRHISQGPILEADLMPLRLLAPHLRRAVTISRLMDLQRVAAASFARALDALPSAVLLVDEALGIVHANTAAEALLSVGDAICSHAGQLLAVAQPRSQAALADALARIAHGGNDALGQRGIGIPIARKQGAAAPLVAHVLPLQGGELRAGLSQRARAAIFVADAAASLNTPAQALALLYDLTPAEARIFELVAAGGTPAAIAARLGLARSTVKSHLLRLFEKTGCHRQADLIRLAAALAA